MMLMSDVEFLDEAQNYWEDYFDEVVAISKKRRGINEEY